MFEESIFEGACATSTAEVLLIIAGSLGLGILLGYLIWGWLRRKVNELESRVIGLSKSVEDQEGAIGQLETENASLTEELEKSKKDFDLKSAQYTNVITRMRTLEEKQDDDPETSSMKEEITKLEERLKHQMEEIDKLELALKTAQTATATTIVPAEDTPVKATPGSRRGRTKKTGTPAAETKAEAPKRKRGRPKKTETASTETTAEAPKRKRGRPKKSETPAAETPVESPKRKRGRPKKTETASTETTVEAPKRKRGRPKKTETASAEGTTETTKRKRGRPKGSTNKKARRSPGRPKKTETASSETSAEAPKRKRGRPKKSEAAKAETATTKKRRGRPKKTETATSTTAKKTRSKRGRPKGSKNKPKVYRGADVIQDASQVFGKRIKQDDLTLIEGIGPKLASLFRDNGLETWSKVADASQQTLQQTVEKIGPRHHIHDPQTWPRQATMASKGEWKKLKAYQDSLTRGKKG